MMITVLQRAEVERARARRIVACTHAAALAAAAARGGRQVPRPLPAAGAAAAVLPLSPLLPTQVGVAHPSGVLGPLIPPPPPPLPLPLTPLQSPGRGVVVGMPGSEYTGRGQDLRQDARFSGPNGEVVVNAVAMTGSAAAPDQQGLAVDGGRATAVPARVGGERMALSAAHGVAPGTTPSVSPTVTPSATPYVVPSTATGASGDGGPVVSLDEDASAVSLGGGCAAAAVTCSAGKVLANGDCYGGAEIAARVEDSRDGGKRQPPLVANNRSDRQQQQQQQQSLAALGGAQEGLLPQGEHRIAVAAAATAGGSGGADGEAGVAMRGDGVSEAANIGDVGDHLNLSDAPHPHSRHASHGEGDPVAPAGPAVAVLSPGAANQGMYPAPLQQPGGGGGAHMQGALLPPPALPLAAQRSIDMNADLFHMKHMEITLSPEEVERADLRSVLFCFVFTVFVFILTVCVRSVVLTALNVRLFTFDN